MNSGPNTTSETEVQNASQPPLVWGDWQVDRSGTVLFRAAFVNGAVVASEEIPLAGA